MQGKRLLILAFGSRGDVQPILALAGGLIQSGYAVTIAAGKDFRTWIESRGYHFADVGVDMQQLLNSDVGKEWVGNSTNSVQEARNMKAVLDIHSATVGEALLGMVHDADVIISNLPTFGMAQALAEKYHKLHIRVMLAPLTPTAYAESTMIPVVPRRRNPLNYLSNYAGIYFIYWINRDSINAFRARLGLPAWGYGDFARAWNRMPILYGVSPHLMPRDPAWRPDTVVTGFWFDPPASDWQPPARLSEFLAAHPRPIYMGFGSMAAKDPQATLATMLAALEQTGQAGIIYSGWAGLNAEKLPPNVHIIDGAPHAWLFPRMAALIHHGGAGTTAAGLAAGVPATVVSHMADQPYWGRRLYELGIGARPIHRHQFNVTRLIQAIETMLGDPGMAVRATTLATQLQAENGVNNAVEAINAAVRSVNWQDPEHR